MKQVIIYTDGACSGNPGPGGWGAILKYGAHERELSGGEPSTTNNRMELLLFRSDDQREAGYALVTVCSPYGYVLVHMLTIYPFLRRQLLGRVAAELVARCYAGKRGVLYCQSRTCAVLPERERMLRENGYRDTGFRFRWNGQPAALYLHPCQSTEDITPVALLLLRDLYGDLLTPVNARRMIQPEA